MPYTLYYSLNLITAHSCVLFPPLSDLIAARRGHPQGNALPAPIVKVQINFFYLMQTYILVFLTSNPFHPFSFKTLTTVAQAVLLAIADSVAAFHSEHKVTCSWCYKFGA